MAECSRNTFSLSVQSVIDDIDTHSSDISDELRLEMRQTLQDIMELETSERLQRGLASANSAIDNNAESLAIKCIRVVMKFTGQKLLQVSKLVPLPAGIVLSAIAVVVTHVFSRDIVAEVAGEFRDILDDRFMTKCHATSQKFRNCLRYINGLPRATNLNTTDRKMYLDRLASDNPINTGLKEISILSVDIQRLISSQDSPDMSLLMKKVQMYCCLTTFRELFLLARFAIESAYGIDTQSIINVLEGQRHDDQRLLRFLYRPNRNTLTIFLKYTPSDWPVVVEFLQRRRLVTDITAYADRTFQIRSVEHPESLLSVHDLKLLTVVRCHDGTEGDHTLFRLMVRQGGAVTFHPFTRPDYYIYSKDWVRMDSNPAQRLREWQIVQMEPDTQNEDPYYLFRLHSQENSCVFVDFTGRVYVWKYKNGDVSCFWRFTPTATTEVN